MSDRDRVQLLLWRAGLGATPAQVDVAAAKGYAAAVEDVLNYPDVPASDAPDVPEIPAQKTVKEGASADEIAVSMKTRNEAINTGFQAVTAWWASRLRTSPTPLQENLTLFWHNHFVSAADKVRYPNLLLGQNQLLRAKGAGKFEDLLIAVSKDAAMLLYLDGAGSVKEHPNENWAREVMELFTIGIGNYTEGDVREAARASTGWMVNPQIKQRELTGTFVPKNFDSGMKTIFGQTGNFGLDDLSRMLTARPETARFVSRKLFVWFVADDPSDSDLAPMIEAWNASGGEIRSVLRAMFLSDSFTPERATQAHVKNPVMWTIGTLRSLDADFDGTRIYQLLAQQGMTLFYPPNVSGWPRGMSWISPSSQVLRYNLAGTLVQKAGMLNGSVDAPFLAQLSDRLGGVPIPDTMRDRLLDLGKTNDGKRAVAQVLLAGAGYQTR